MPDPVKRPVEALPQPAVQPPAQVISRTNVAVTGEPQAVVELEIVTETVQPIEDQTEPGVVLAAEPGPVPDHKPVATAAATAATTTTSMLHEDEGEGLFADLFSGAEDLGATPAGFADTLRWDDEAEPAKGLDVAPPAQTVPDKRGQVDPFVGLFDEEESNGQPTTNRLGADESGPADGQTTGDLMTAELIPPPLDFPLNEVTEAAAGEPETPEKVPVVQRLAGMLMKGRGVTQSKVVRLFIGIIWLMVGVKLIIFVRPVQVDAANVGSQVSTEITLLAQPETVSVEYAPAGVETAPVEAAETGVLPTDTALGDGLPALIGGANGLPQPATDTSDLTETLKLYGPGATAAVMMPSFEGDQSAAEAIPEAVAVDLKPAALYLKDSQDPIVVAETTTTPVEVEGRTYQRWQVPRYDAGHHVDTPAFGQAGNTTIVGHSIWYGETGVFAPVLKLDVGDLIKAVNDDGSTYTYRVTRRWSSPYEDNSWLKAPDDPNRKLLTLYTCNLDLTALVVVQAELVDQEGGS